MLQNVIHPCCVCHPSVLQSASRPYCKMLSIHVIGTCKILASRTFRLVEIDLLDLRFDWERSKNVKKKSRNDPKSRTIFNIYIYTYIRFLIDRTVAIMLLESKRIHLGVELGRAWLEMEVHRGRSETIHWMFMGG